MFENRPQEVIDIALAIDRHLIALGIAFDDDAAMADLARDVLDPVRHAALHAKAEQGDLDARSRETLAGLADLMLAVMTKSALEDHVALEGDACWKAYARALVTQQKIGA